MRKAVSGGVLLVCVVMFLSLGLIDFAEARSGCCSHHDGVCGCGCCDGTPLSATCAPYYPSCGPTKAEVAPVVPAAPVIPAPAKVVVPVAPATPAVVSSASVSNIVPVKENIEAKSSAPAVDTKANGVNDSSVDNDAIAKTDDSAGTVAGATTVANVDAENSAKADENMANNINPVAVAAANEIGKTDAAPGDDGGSGALVMIAVLGVLGYVYHKAKRKKR